MYIYDVQYLMDYRVDLHIMLNQLSSGYPTKRTMHMATIWTCTTVYITA